MPHKRHKKQDNEKSEYNKYLEIFRGFVEAMEKIQIQGAVNTTVFARLQKLIRESKDVAEFTKKLATDYCVCVDEKLDEIIGLNCIKKGCNRAMFSSEIEEKILNQVKEG